MNTSYIQSLIYEGMKTVEVQILTNKMITKQSLSERTLTYKTYLYLTVGDVVVVPVINCEQLRLAKVCKVHTYPTIPKDSEHDYKWITQVVDTTKIKESFKVDEEFEEELQKQNWNKEKESIIKDLDLKPLQDTVFLR